MDNLRTGQDWLAFFREACIPEEAAKTYAASFVEHEMTGDMLGESRLSLLYVYCTFLPVLVSGYATPDASVHFLICLCNGE